MSRGGGEEKLLVARQSAFHAIRVTQDAAGLRTLRFGAEGASQSIVKSDDPRHLELPYARLLPACLAFHPFARRVLIVGLGGGTLPRFLHSHFPEMTIDVVEIDADVLAVAKEFCGFREDPRLRVTIADGRDIIEAVEGSYDMIVLDSFGAESIPEHLTTLEFVQAVRQALAPAGFAVANIWGPAVNPLYADMLLTYRAAFADVYVLDVPVARTKLFVGLPTPRLMERCAVLDAARTLTRERNFQYDLPATIAGFRHAELETTRGGSILRD